jgi:riboflavin synthase
MSGSEDISYRLVDASPVPAWRSRCPSSPAGQGHVDDTATLISKTPDGDSLRLLFQLNETTPTRPSLLPYLIPKGYVAIDGTSLTLTEVDDDKRVFGIMLIQHTQENITLGKKSVGSKVNIEVDMVGKYVEKNVTATLSGQGSGSTEWQRLIENVVHNVLARKGI